MKTFKKVFIKVQRIIETLSRMSIYNASIIFSRMNIIFSSNAGNVIFRCIFLEKIIFFDRKVILYLSEKKSLRNGVLFVLAWVAWVVCLCGWPASVGGVFAWVVC